MILCFTESKRIARVCPVHIRGMFYLILY